MTTQINLRITDSFLKQARTYAKNNGFLNVQEFFREAVREKLFEQPQVREDYVKRLKSTEANSFLSDKESKEFEMELSNQ